MSCLGMGARPVPIDELRMGLGLRRGFVLAHQHIMTHVTDIAVDKPILVNPLGGNRTETFQALDVLRGRRD